MGRWKVCPRCPQVIPRDARYCPACAPVVDRERGTTTERGYGTEHQRLREAIAPTVWGKPCARCGRPILVGQAWHLDHDDDDRTSYLGASHAACNVRARRRNRAS